MMRTRASRPRVRAAGLACLLAVPLAAAACAAQDEEGSGEEGGGVAFGASMEEYHDAFADIDPITLHTQTPAPKGSLAGARNEAYVEAVEEWSDGKITFDIQYANAIAAPTESDDALADGRLDVTNVMAVYEPAEYPANVALNDASFVGSQTPIVGVLAAHAWMIDVAHRTDEMGQELADRGIHVLTPAFNSGHSMMICSDARTSLDDFDGAQVLSGGTTQGAQIEALGATPISVPYTEVYESLQRGVADCTVSSLLGVDLSGYAEVANHVTYNPDAGFAITTAVFGMSASTWETLPLVAQQLLHDRVDVYLEASVMGTWEADAAAVEQILAAGGEFVEYDPKVSQALASANDGLLDEVRTTEALDDGDAFVDAVLGSSEEWVQRVEELGYQDAEDFEAFADTIRNDPPDLEPFTSLLAEELLLPHRPS